MPLKVRWLSEIEKARKGTRDHIDKDAAFWRKVLKETEDAQRDLVLDAISEERTARVERAMARLIEASKKAKYEYVMAGLSENKYRDRSNAIGKRFGRLKTDAKFGSQYVFHSIRHTVATMFKSLRVEEAIAADILGHEHDRITYGRYGDAAYWQTLVDVVRILDYPEQFKITGAQI